MNKIKLSASPSYGFEHGDVNANEKRAKFAKTRQYGSNIFKIIGYVPVLGTIVGTGRLIDTLVSKVIACVKGHQPEVQHPKAYLAGRLTRGIIETFSLGIIFLPFDIIVTIVRKNQNNDMKHEKSEIDENEIKELCNQLKEDTPLINTNHNQRNNIASTSQYNKNQYTHLAADFVKNQRAQHKKLNNFKSYFDKNKNLVDIKVGIEQFAELCYPYNSLTRQLFVGNLKSHMEFLKNNRLNNDFEKLSSLIFNLSYLNICSFFYKKKYRPNEKQSYSPHEKRILEDAFSLIKDNHPNIEIKEKLENYFKNPLGKQINRMEICLGCVLYYLNDCVPNEFETQRIYFKILSGLQNRNVSDILEGLKTLENKKAPKEIMLFIKDLQQSLWYI